MLADRTLDGAFELVQTQLGPQLRALLDVLSLHMDWEERELVPMLRATAPEGDDWSRHLLTEHEHQREELRAMAAVAASGVRDNPAGVAFAVESFLADLLADMNLEERQCLAPTVLHAADELVVTDQVSD